MSPFRHPVVAVSHGPGPLWLLKDGVFGISTDAESAHNVRAVFPTIYNSKDAPLPKRIVVVSAHFESSSSGFEISKATEPEMFYDYYGLPGPAYEVVYAAKGDPAFAQRVADALSQHKIAHKLVERGFDHGVFVPMALIRPQADIPVVSVSINSDLSAAAHFELGQALAPFRDEDTLIICSGHATHNMRGSRDPSAPVSEWAQSFQDWLDSVCSDASTLSYAERQAALCAWEQVAPFGKTAHPTPDHFTPFVVAAGAGMEEKKPEGEKIIGGWGMGQFSFASYAWGIAK
ncbi:Udp-n-acetylglucosamine--peptide n-acetylglucosaminyltransferase sec [Globisporangium polare]